jgi:hypothetical protein
MARAGTQALQRLLQPSVLHRRDAQPANASLRFGTLHGSYRARLVALLEELPLEHRPMPMNVLGQLPDLPALDSRGSRLGLHLAVSFPQVLSLQSLFHQALIQRLHSSSFRPSFLAASRLASDSSTTFRFTAQGIAAAVAPALGFRLLRGPRGVCEGLACFSVLWPFAPCPLQALLRSYGLC